MGRCIECKYDDILPDKEPCNICFKHNKFEKKEGNNSMEKKKIINTEDIFKEENKDCIFIRENGKEYLWVQGVLHVKRESGRLLPASPILKLNEQWVAVKKIPEQVPFMAAMKALDQGKTVICKINGRTMHYVPENCNSTVEFGKCIRDGGSNAIRTKEILDGKWYIKE